MAFYNQLSRPFTPFDSLLWSAGVQIRPTPRNTVFGYVECFLAASEEARGLEQRIRETVRDHIFDVGVSGACLALAYVNDHFPDMDLLSADGAGFEGTQVTTGELGVGADLFFCVVRSCLWTVWFNPLRGIFGS